MPSKNPYYTGNPVGDTEAFIGRKKILRTVKETIDDLHRNALVLYGQRRIGKTSVLKQLEALLSEKYCPIFWNWQDKADWTLLKVLEELAQVVSLSLDQTKPTLTTNPQTAFKQWLADQLLNSQNKPVVFLFDEFDVIATSGKAKEIVGYLGQLLPLNPQRLNCLFVIGCQLEQLTDDTLELFRIRNVENKFISLLTQPETEDLIRLSEKNQTLQWSESAMKKIWQLTDGHPYFTQQLCSKVWEHLYQEPPPQPPTVTVGHVNGVIPQVMEATESILESLWRSLPVMERVVAAMLAQQQAQWSECIRPLTDIAQLLEKGRTSLSEWELIQAEGNDDYRFRVEIIRLWMEKKAFHDDLDMIESHASDIYKIARQLYAEQYLESAQALLEQAVRLNRYHTKATQLLATILLEQNQLESARQVLENLYQYNPNVAKDPLVQVLLELALFHEHDQETEEKVFWKKFIPSYSHEERQLELYNHVLEIDTNNLTAANGKHKILQQQQARTLKSWLKSFYDDYSKRIWEIIGFFTIVGGYPIIFSLQLFPATMVLEIEKKGERVYWLRGVPSSQFYQLQQMSITPLPPGFKIESLKFKYGSHQEIELPKTESGYLVDKTILSTMAPEINSLEYPHKDNQITFEFRFEFEGEVLQEPNFGCQARVRNDQPVDCVPKQAGFLSVFRGIPWYGIGVPLGIIWIILVEIVYALRNREKDDVF